FAEKKAEQHLGSDQATIRKNNNGISIQESDVGIQASYSEWLEGLYQLWNN
ncbi:MAG: hypothetical protein RI953_1979, partial [Pseudomonadota bacterium]